MSSILLTQQVAFARNPCAVNRSKVIVPILRDLWNTIVPPVCDCLTELAVPQKSRIWWCPTSNLCALPLHAAGPWQPEQRNLPDIYISSYTPTLFSLITARYPMFNYRRPVFPKLLIVGGEPLEYIQREIHIVQAFDPFSTCTLVGAAANRDTILDSLKKSRRVHFACNGRLGDNTQPFNASFELHGDSRLTLLDLIQTRLPNAELAFLSVPYSAAGHLSSPYETINLAAALQFCGF